MSSQGRQLSWVEAAVVTVVIAVVVGLTLPAVQKTRQANLRAESSAHLKRVGEATLAFHDAHRRLPGIGERAAGATADPGRPELAPFQYQILPFLGDAEAALYRHPAAAGTDSPAVVKAYLEPARRRTGHIAGRPLTDYAVNLLAPHGRWTDPAASTAGEAAFPASAGGLTPVATAALVGARRYGPFPLYPVAVDGVRPTATLCLGQFTDGPSSTILAGGKCLRPDEYHTTADASFLDRAAAGVWATDAPAPTAPAKGQSLVGHSAYDPGERRTAAVRDDDPGTYADGVTPRAGIAQAHFGGPYLHPVLFVFCDGHAAACNYSWTTSQWQRSDYGDRTGPSVVVAGPYPSLRVAMTPNGNENCPCE